MRAFLLAATVATVLAGPAFADDEAALERMMKPALSGVCLPFLRTGKAEGARLSDRIEEEDSAWALEVTLVGEAPRACSIGWVSTVGDEPAFGAAESVRWWLERWFANMPDGLVEQPDGEGAGTHKRWIFYQGRSLALDQDDEAAPVVVTLMNAG